MRGKYDYKWRCDVCGYEHNFDGGYCPRCKDNRQTQLEDLGEE